MIKIYGIKTCGSVKKAFTFFKNNKIDYEFIDFKTNHVDSKKIKEWLQFTDISTILNTKGTKYKTLKLKELNLTDAQKLGWLEKENILIKRPIIEIDNKQILVGFDEEKYKNVFLHVRMAK